MADNRYIAVKDLQKQKNADALAEYLGAVNRDRAAQENKAQETVANIAETERLAKQYPDRGVHVGDISVAGKDPFQEILRMQQLKAMQDERLDKAVQQGSKALIDSNLPSATAAFQRAEQVAPGVISGKAQPKSVGGWKNIVPNVLVAPAEKLGLLPKGSSDERAALQELANVKLYDSSGKAINESEMKRIQDSFGIRGMLDPSTLQQALHQMGQSILSKGRTAEAGIRPEAKRILQERGAVSVDPLEALLKGTTSASQAPPPSPQDIMARIQALEAKKAKAQGN